MDMEDGATEIGVQASTSRRNRTNTGNKRVASPGLSPTPPRATRTANTTVATTATASAAVTSTPASSTPSRSVAMPVGTAVSGGSRQSTQSNTPSPAVPTSTTRNGAANGAAKNRSASGKRVLEQDETQPGQSAQGQGRPNQAGNAGTSRLLQSALQPNRMGGQSNNYNNQQFQRDGESGDDRGGGQKRGKFINDTVQYFQKINKIALASGFRNAQEMIASQKEIQAIMHGTEAQIESTDAVCSVLERYVINQNFAEVIHSSIPFSSIPFTFTIFCYSILPAG